MSWLTYQINDVPLIPQDEDNACWYASAQMLIQWRRNRTQSTEMAFSDPSEVPAAVDLHRTNDQLPIASVVQFARLLGLQSVPPMTPTDRTIYDWLVRYGPIWTAGNFGGFGHAVVITGISPMGFSINDPWPVNVGRKYMCGVDFLTTLLTLKSNEIQSNFLHFPN